MTTLAEMKKQLADMDAAWQAVNADNNEDTKARFRAAQLEVNMNLADKLRAQLAVVDAAAALMKASPDYDSYKHKEDALKEALKALE